MDTIDGITAIRKIEEVCRLGGDFCLGFYSYSRIKKVVDGMRTYKNCVLRQQLPREKWSIDGKNFLLFETNDGPKMCYRVLIRYVGFPADNYKLKKVIWYE